VHRARRCNRRRRLSNSRVEFREVCRRLQNFARLAAIGWAYEAVAFHRVDEVGGAAVAYAQAALQEAGASFAECEDAGLA
jgi:hypothetical protein